MTNDPRRDGLGSPWIYSVRPTHVFGHLITFWHILHHVRGKCLPWSECRSCRSLLRCSAHAVTTVAGGRGHLHVAEVGRTASGQGERGPGGPSRAPSSVLPWFFCCSGRRPHPTGALWMLLLPLSLVCKMGITGMLLEIFLKTVSGGKGCLHRAVICGFAKVG